MATLTDRELEILEFSRAHYKYLGVRQADIRDRFGISLTRYTQILDALLQRPEAMAYDARLVRTHLEQKDRLRAARTGSTR